jgi:hypothetical protein
MKKEKKKPSGFEKEPKAGRQTGRQQLLPNVR